METNKDYRYFQGESICPKEDFVSELKCAFWEAEANYYTNEKELSNEYPTPYDFMEHYCDAISDKWYAGNVSAVDIFKDYLDTSKDTLNH